MPAAIGTLAFLGYQEIAIVLVVGLLLYGRRLPEVGRQVGRTIQEFRRGLNQLRNEIDRDDSLREARGAISDFKRQLDAPREAIGTLRSPQRLLDRLTDESMASAGPGATYQPPPAGSFLDTAKVDEDGPTKSANGSDGRVPTPDKAADQEPGA